MSSGFWDKVQNCINLGLKILFHYLEKIISVLIFVFKLAKKDLFFYRKFNDKIKKLCSLLKQAPDENGPYSEIGVLLLNL